MGSLRTAGHRSLLNEDVRPSLTRAATTRGAANVTSQLVSSLAGGMHVERIDSARLRANWLLRCADAIGLSSLMSVAGTTSWQLLNEIAL